MKTVSDSMGQIDIPDNAFYGAQTARALQNFEFGDSQVNRHLIAAIIEIKRAAAKANEKLEVLSPEKSQAIVRACDKAMNLDFSTAFPVSVFQTGSGTSTNMNVNEVLSALASEHTDTHPNDDVNCSQSSNDVIPTAIQIAASQQVLTALFPAIDHLITVISGKADSLNSIVKTGRTHLMDAMPLTVGQELNGWAAALTDVRGAIQKSTDALHFLPQGGTAIGSGINCPDGFSEHFCEFLNDQISGQYQPITNRFYGISFQEVNARLAGTLKSLATILVKISNDLRWMNSGPLTGISDIQLKELQPGSSIMPGKVNPVIPEAVIMACYSVIGLETTISLSQHGSNFQLNVCLPVIGQSLLTMIRLLSECSVHLADKAIADMKVNESVLAEGLAKNPILATALNTRIGYSKAAELAKKAYQQQRPILDVAIEMLDIPENELRQLLDPKQMT